MGSLTLWLSGADLFTYNGVYRVCSRPAEFFVKMPKLQNGILVKMNKNSKYNWIMSYQGKRSPKLAILASLA